MWPPSIFASPVSSFEAPVNPPGVSPDQDPKVAVVFNQSWLKYVVGSITQLWLQSTWQGTPDQIALAQAQAQNLFWLFATATVPLEQLTGVGCDCEECMCCLRIQNGVLQMFQCGQWVDVPGQQANGNQPGNGSQQPPPGGGTATYNGCMDAKNKFFVPTLVNTGDVLQLTSTSGSWNDHDADGPIWRCPNGLEFVAGACLNGTSKTVSTDPINSAPHMSIIMEIAGTFYAFDSSGSFTVPSGVVNQSVILQANDSDLSDDFGNICFAMQVQNNQSATWTQIFDFTLSQAGWQPIVVSGTPYAVYTPGVGWTQANVGPVSWSDNIFIDFSATNITSMSVTHSSDQSANLANHEVDVNSGSFYMNLTNGPFSGTDTHTALGSGVNHIETAYGRDATPEPNMVISKIVVTGTGTNPFA